MRIFSTLVAAAAALVLGGESTVLPPEYARGGRVFRELSARHGSTRASLHAPDVTLDAQFLTQNCNHFNSSDSCSFDQKYFVDLASDSSKPLLLYINGEGPVSGLPTGYVRDMADKYGATLATLEHRFYGESVPNNNRNVDNLKLLTVEQALMDLKTFQSYLQWKHDLTGPVIVAGGSYSGALSAWHRIYLPSLTVGGWSSSGVVNALVEYPEFDQSISESAGTECAAAMRNLTSALETANTADPAALRRKFNADENMSDPDFFYAMADGVAMGIQYDNKATVCSVLTQAVVSGTDIVDASVSLFNDLWGKDFTAGAFYNTPAVADPTCKGMARSWRYQKCTELGYLQDAPASSPIRSTVLSMDNLIKQCHDIFGASFTPNSDAIQARFGGAQPTGTNVVYADASDDPWRSASVTSKPSPYGTSYAFSQCDGCGHCSDMAAQSPDDPASLKQTRVTIDNAIASWLADWEAKKGTVRSVVAK